MCNKKLFTQLRNWSLTISQFSIYDTIYLNWRMLFKHYGKHLGKSHLKISRSIYIFDDFGYFENSYEVQGNR